MVKQRESYLRWALSEVLKRCLGDALTRLYTADGVLLAASLPAPLVRRHPHPDLGRLHSCGGELPGPAGQLVKVRAGSGGQVGSEGSEREASDA